MHGIIPTLFFEEAQVLLDFFEIDFDAPAQGVELQDFLCVQLDICGEEHGPVVIVLVDRTAEQQPDLHPFFLFRLVRKIHLHIRRAGSVGRAVETFHPPFEKQVDLGCRVLFSVDSVFEIAFFHSKDTAQLCGDDALDILLVAEPRVAHNMGEGNPLADAALEHIPEHLVFVFILRYAAISGNTAAFVPKLRFPVLNPFFTHINPRIQRNVSFWGRQPHFKHLLAHDLLAQRVIEVAADRRDLFPPSMFDRVINDRRTDCFASQVVLSDQLEGYIQTEPTPVDVLPLQEVVQNILTPIDEGRKTLAAEKMKRRNPQQRPDQHREQNLPDRIPPVLHQPEAMGFRKKGQILRGKIQFIVNEPICPGNVVHQWSATDFAWLFFHFGPVIGVGIVALNHYRLQYHHSVIYSNYISML